MVIRHDVEYIQFNAGTLYIFRGFVYAPDDIRYHDEHINKFSRKVDDIETATAMDPNQTSATFYQLRISGTGVKVDEADININEMHLTIDSQYNSIIDTNGKIVSRKIVSDAPWGLCIKI